MRKSRFKYKTLHKTTLYFTTKSYLEENMFYYAFLNCKKN